MKQPTNFVVFMQVILFAALISQSCHEADVNKSFNPFVGTWKRLGGFDSVGKLSKQFQGEVGYATFLEDGGYFTLGFTKDFSQTRVYSSIIEERTAAIDNMWGLIGSYSVDKENGKIHTMPLYNISPIYVESTANFKIAIDILIIWNENEDIYFKYQRVK